MPKLVPVLLLALTCSAASAQDRAAPQPAQNSAPDPAQDPALVRAQKAAPELLELAGSPENFESLVLGLHRGAPVRLAAPADGQLRVTTFRAPAPLPLERVISVLQEASQTLAQLGIARPAPEQIAVALSGGVLELPTGSTELPGLLAAAAGPRTRVEPQWPPRKPSPEQQAFAALPAEIRALLGALPVRRRCRGSSWRASSCWRSACRRLRPISCARWCSG